MTVPAAPPADLLLDACSALRADLATRDAAASPPPAIAADAAPAPPNIEAVAAWLPLVVSLERAAQLPARQRAAHFRQARLAWEAAAAACAEPRYTALGARLACWRTPDPRLLVVKEVLWAMEQPEAAGYTHLALAGYTALGRLVPPDDVRQGYVLAQSARALRTLGAVDAATERYTLSERLGATHHDRWLRVRSAIGLGATYHHAGNYPATRTVLRRVLRKGSPDARFTAAAHHGLLLGAMAAKDWDSALAHGWHLLRAGRRGVVPRIDVLLLMASLCRSIGRYRAAVSAATAALTQCVRPDDPMLAHKIIADVALATGDEVLGRMHAAHLRAHLRTGGGPYEDARALHTLALVEERWGDRTIALHNAGAAQALAQIHRYHELAYHIEPTIERLQAAARSTPWADPSPPRSPLLADWNTPDTVQLRPASQRIVARLTTLTQAIGPLTAVV